MIPQGEIFIVHGDITQITADAIAYPTSIATWKDIPGELTPAFDKHYPGVTAQWEAMRAQKAEETTRPHFDYGELFWIPLGEEHAPYGVVVVAAGGKHSVTPQDQAERQAVIGAVREAARRLREREQHLGKTPERLLIALPAFRIGRGGSREKDMAAAVSEVQAARDALDEEEHAGIDVVFVTFTPRHYQIFLEARRTCGLAPAVPSGALPEDLLDALEGGKCVLFIGAGLSKAAGMMDFKSLIGRLAADLDIVEPLSDDMDTYLDLAQWHREKFPDGDKRVHALVKHEFGAGAAWANPTVDHYWLMSLPVHYVVTTNYDTLLERTLEAQKRFPNTAVTQEDVARTGGRDGVHVIKFHGDADQRVEDQDKDDLVLSRDDYDRFFSDRPVMASLLQGLLLNQTFFFVGYSLRDPNFRQIYSNISLMLDKSQRPAYATTFDTVSDYQKQQYKSKQLHLLPMQGTLAGKVHADLEEKVHAERCLLDQIAEHAAGQALFLADCAEPAEAASSPTGRFGDLQRLLCQAGEEVVRLGRGALTLDEAQQMARTLTFLADAGWRPKGSSLAQLWLTLAERVDTMDTSGRQHRQFQRSLLLYALAHAESQEMAESVRDRLAVITGKGDEEDTK